MQELPDHYPTGTEVLLDDLAALRPLARKLVFAHRREHLALGQGNHESRLRGRGLEFREVREYQAGDDIRHIDWRVTARTSKAHTKVFQEERERPVLLCLDQRQSMFFGSRRCFKHVFAAHAALMLAWAALFKGDRVGGLVFNDQGHREIRPRRSGKSVLHLASTACEFSQQLPMPASEHDLGVTLEEMRRITRPGSTIYLISDFYGLSANAEKQLALLARHNDVFALSVSDRLESEFPLQGRMTLSDGQQRLTLDADPQFRQRFEQQQRQQHDSRDALFRRSRLRHIPLLCGDPLFSTLLEGLRR